MAMYVWLCMCVCAYVCMAMNVQLCMYVWLRMATYGYVWLRMATYGYVCMYGCLYLCIQVCTKFIYVCQRNTFHCSEIVSAHQCNMKEKDTMIMLLLRGIKWHESTAAS